MTTISGHNSILNRLKSCPRIISTLVIDNLIYAVRLNLTAFDKEQDQLVYVFKPQPEEVLKNQTNNEILSYRTAVGSACGHNAFFRTYSDYDTLTEDMMYDIIMYKLPYIELIEKNDDYVIYNLAGLFATTKQVRKFAKDNFKFYVNFYCVDSYATGISLVIAGVCCLSILVLVKLLMVWN